VHRIRKIEHLVALKLREPFRVQASEHDILYVACAERACTGYRLQTGIKAHQRACAHADVQVGCAVLQRLFEQAAK
jgi:hypothetical protein